MPQRQDAWETKKGQEAAGGRDGQQWRQHGRGVELMKSTQPHLCVARRGGEARGSRKQAGLGVGWRGVEMLQETGRQLDRSAVGPAHLELVDLSVVFLE